jgi:hypothetical protein
MRRALTRATLLAVSLLAVALVLVPVASAVGAGEEPEREIEIDMHVGGFHVGLFADEGDGKQRSAVLYLTRRHQFAEYIVPAQITDSTIKARFGSLGELDYSFVPKGSTDAECFGASGSEAEFTGTFTFTGERNYIHIDADRATGTFKLYPEPPACAPRPADPVAPAARAVPYQPYVGDGATLTASTLATKTNRRVRALTISRGQSANQANVSAVLAEADPGLSIVRGVQTRAPARAFEWDFVAGAATVRPPAPFAGTATFTRRPDGRKLFTGSLRAPILGGKTIRLAGGAFHPALHHGTPHDE